MLFEITVPQFIKVLGNLNGLLDKAAAHAEMKKYDVKNVLNARLAPDQFNFIRQVQIATDTAKGAAARLAGQEPPKYEDNEQTLDELRTRLHKTIEFLKTVKPAQFDGAAKRMIKIPHMPGKGLAGFEFVVQMGLPNFYFHVTTAYSILRHNGIEIGKGDYLGALPLKDL